MQSFLFLLDASHVRYLLLFIYSLLALQAFRIPLTFTLEYTRRKRLNIILDINLHLSTREESSSSLMIKIFEYS